MFSDFVTELQHSQNSDAEFRFLGIVAEVKLVNS